MYVNHFGLQLAPFDDRPDPLFYFATPDRDEALAAMECCLRHGGGAQLVLGSAGTGKTTLLRAFLRRLESTDRAVVVTCPHSGDVDFLEQLSVSLGRTGLGGPATGREIATDVCARVGEQISNCEDRRGRDHRVRLLRAISRKLKKRAAGGRIVVVVDQAENLDFAGLKDLMFLLEQRESTGSSLSVIVAAQPQLHEALRGEDLARLRQALYGERVLAPLSAAGTREYVRHRLRVAGAATPDCFESAALDLIHAHTGGIPRLINKVCDAAMIAAYGADEDRVPHAVINELMGGEATHAPKAPSVGESHRATQNEAVAAPACCSSSAYSAIPTRSDFNLALSERATFKSAPSDAAERQALLMESKLQRAATVAAEMERQVERAQRACERAEELSSRLTTFADQIADRAEDLQSRINLLFGNLSAAQSLESRLREAAALFEAASSAAPQRAASIRAELHGVLERMAGDAESRVSAALKEQEGRITTLTATVAASQTGLSRIEGAIVAANARAADICEDMEKRAERLLRSAEGRLQDLLDSAQTKQAVAEEQLIKLTEKHGAVHAAVERTAKTTESVAGEIAGIRSDLEELDRSTDRVASVARDSNQAIHEKLCAADALLATSHEAHHKAAELHSKIAAVLVDAAAGCERVQDACQRVTLHQAACERLAMNAESAEVTANLLAERVAAAEQSRAAVNESLSRSAVAMEQIERRNLSAVEAAVRLESATAEARISGEGAQVAAAAARTASELAESSARQLNVATVAAGKVLGSATAQVDAAKKAQLALSEMMLGADDKLNRLASHQAAASQVLTRVAEATREAHSTVVTLNAARKEAGEAAEISRELSQIVDAAGESLKQLDSAVNLGSNTATGLQSRIAESIASGNALQLGCEQAGQVLERIERAAEALRRVDEAHNELQPLLEQLGQGKSQLVEWSTRGETAAERLAELLETARDTIGSQRDATLKAEQTGARVAQQLDQLHAVEPMLAELSGQIGILYQDAAQWEARMSEIENKVNGMSEEPTRILEAARTQTAELERVLTAVRKIFSGLSQASLAAKKQADSLDATGRTTAERLAQLSGGAEKATQMLAQWVAEAVRVQSRLEALVAAAPGIGETHPSGPLHDLAESLATPDRKPAQNTPASTAGTRPALKPPAPSDQQVRTQPRAPRVLPARTVPAKSVPLRPDVHRRNAEEIAAILEDARRAAEEA